MRDERGERETRASSVCPFSCLMHAPFRLVPPRRRKGVLLCIPFRMIGIPVTHDLIHLATVHTAGLPLSLFDEVAEERGAWRKRHMIDVAVQGLVHSEHELSHTHFLSLNGTSARVRLRYAIGC